MKTSFHALKAVALLASGALLLAAVPAQADSVAKARAECAQHKAKVHQLEARSTDPDSDSKLVAARAAWEDACYRASQLMVKSGLQDPAKPVVPRQREQSIYLPAETSTSVTRYPTGPDPDATPEDPDGDGVPTYRYRY